MFVDAGLCILQRRVRQSKSLRRRYMYPIYSYTHIP